MSDREIKQAAEKIIKNEIKGQKNRKQSPLDLNLTVKKIIMLRLGIPVDRIAKRLNISQKKLLKVQRSFNLFSMITKIMPAGKSHNILIAQCPVNDFIQVLSVRCRKKERWVWSGGP
jgi:hypothetical protein